MATKILLDRCLGCKSTILEGAEVCYGAFQRSFLNIELSALSFELLSEFELVAVGRR